MKTLNEEIKNAIKNCVSSYRNEEGFEENLGDTLHENLSSQGIHAEDEEEFAIWEQYAKSLL
jgi:hypothetical protein